MKTETVEIPSTVLSSVETLDELQGLRPFDLPMPDICTPAELMKL
jgi:hypothetical protein